MKVKYIGKVLTLSVVSLIINGCGGSSSSTSNNSLITITAENANKVFVSHTQSVDEVIGFIEYIGLSLKTINSPCLPNKNAARTLDNCEDSELGLIIDGTVTVSGDMGTKQFNMSYSNFRITSMHDSSTISLNEASVDIDSKNGVWIGSLEGEVTKNGDTILLNAYTFKFNEEGYSYNALTKSSALGQWVEEKSTVPLNDSEYEHCLRIGEVAFNGQNNSSLIASYNYNNTTTLQLNGEYFDDVMSCSK